MTAVMSALRLHLARILTIAAAEDKRQKPAGLSAGFWAMF